MAEKEAVDRSICLIKSSGLTSKSCRSVVTLSFSQTFGFDLLLGIWGHARGFCANSASQNLLCLRDPAQVAAIQLRWYQKTCQSFALRSPTGICIHIGDILALQRNLELLIVGPGRIYCASLIHQFVHGAPAVEHYHSAFTNLERENFSILFAPIFESKIC